MGEGQAFGKWNLPWGWELGKEWHLQTGLEVAGGWLGNSDNDAVVGLLGPTLVLRKGRSPLSLEGGSSPTLLSEHTFKNFNLGSDFQFTTHAGLYWDFATHWRVGYRFEHISNADLANPNPGLNMHLLSLSYVF